MESFTLNSVEDLKYSVEKYSSYSAKFVPENIISDKPTDPTSRWSSDSHVPPQYLLLKLESTAIVTSVTFGKYEKSHVCNVKKIQVWGGLSEEHLLLILDCGLKNDAVAETFSLKHTVANTPFPVKYIKLLPLQAWGSTFNFSLWHVKLSGCTDAHIVNGCMHTYTLQCEREALRICLKHLRHKKYKVAYAALTSEANIRLEHPILTQLYTACTEHADTTVVEEIMTRAAASGLLEEYVREQPLIPMWKRLVPTPGSGTAAPGMRGGHQLCIDTASQVIYLFGGWDGQQDLSDFWCYNINANTWTCLSRDTSKQGGPSARSCHKMCLDPDRRQLFTLGRYVDSKTRTADLLKNDFFMYELETGRWTCISEDTAEVGGPKLIFDHQMVMDSKDRVMYVFGGRVLTLSRWEGIDGERGSGGNSNFSPADPQFSGLYKYHVATNTWTCLRHDDSTNPPPSSSSSSTSNPSPAPAGGALNNKQTIKSRVGHSMLFHPTSRQLFILAGQRNKEYLTDFFTYQVDTDELQPITDPANVLSGATLGASSSKAGVNSPASLFPHDGMTLLAVNSHYRSGDVPTAGFTQKATIDPLLQEIHVLSGLSKEKEKKDMVCNSFWVYSIALNRWSCVYHNEMSGDDTDTGKEPCPRFAHQLVYDHVNKIHYMFGGNPGRQTKMRLDDFWALQLCRPSREKLLSEAMFAIRKTKYEELAVENSLKAVQYLQDDLFKVVDHNNTQQTTEFQRLASTLFQPANPIQCHPPPVSAIVEPPPIPLPSFQEFGQQSSSAHSDRLSFNEVYDHSMSSQSSSAHFQTYNNMFQYSKEPSHESDLERIYLWKHHKRSELFNYLTNFFPESMAQPKANLIDLVNL